jgi:hypothetical protein
VNTVAVLCSCPGLLVGTVPWPVSAVVAKTGDRWGISATEAAEGEIEAECGIHGDSVVGEMQSRREDLG